MCFVLILTNELFGFSSSYIFIFFPSELGLIFLFFVFILWQPASKKGASTKVATNKKADGGGPPKSAKVVEPEDVEVIWNVSRIFLVMFLVILSQNALFKLLFDQPSEMSLEEIESRLGSLIQVDTISQLKSSVWKERLEGANF